MTGRDLSLISLAVNRIQGTRGVIGHAADGLDLFSYVRTREMK